MVRADWSDQNVLGWKLQLPDSVMCVWREREKNVCVLVRLASCRKSLIKSVTGVTFVESLWTVATHMSNATALSHTHKSHLHELLREAFDRPLEERLDLHYMPANGAYCAGPDTSLPCSTAEEVCQIGYKPVRERLEKSCPLEERGETGRG